MMSLKLKLKNTKLFCRSHRTFQQHGNQLPQSLNRSVEGLGRLSAIHSHGLQGRSSYIHRQKSIQSNVWIANAYACASSHKAV